MTFDKSVKEETYTPKNDKLIIEFAVSTMNIQRIEEFKIPETTHLAIQELLQTCFADYPKGRSFYKQLLIIIENYRKAIKTIFTSQQLE